MYSQQCLALLRAQHGVITRQQALGAGVAEHEIRALLRRGLWVKVHAGVYREVVARPTWRAALVAACLAHGAVASHRTAARLHGLQGFDRTKLEITVVHGRLVTLDGNYGGHFVDRRGRMCRYHSHAPQLGSGCLSLARARLSAPRWYKNFLAIGLRCTFGKISSLAPLYQVSGPWYDDGVILWGVRAANEFRICRQIPPLHFQQANS